MDALLLLGVPAATGVPVLVITREVLGALTLRCRSEDGSEKLLPLQAAFSPYADAAHADPPTSAFGRRFVTELERRQIRVFRVIVGGLSLQSSHTVEVLDAQGTSLARRELRTLPLRLIDIGELTIAIASCFYRFSGGAQNYHRAMHTKWDGSPIDLLFAVGDNLYLDVAPGQFWESDDAAVETLHRYVQYFFDGGDADLKGYRDVLTDVPVLATCDDHEFWNNYPEPQVQLERTRERLLEDFRRAGRACFDLFQQGLNPDPIVPLRDATEHDGRSFELAIADIPVFVADLRSGRSRRSADAPSMFSEEELARFERWTAELSSPGLFVLGQPLSQLAGGRTDYTPIDFAEQFVRILEALRTASYDVLVISGDIHCSRLVRYVLTGSSPGPVRVVHELICSPVCHIPAVFLSGLSSLFGVDGGIGRGELVAPLEVSASADVKGVPTWAKMRLRDYEQGTDVRQCLGILKLRRTGSEGLEADVGFIDLETNRWAEAKLLELSRTNTGGGSWKPHRGLSRDPCFARRVLKLQRRDTTI